jgi:murein L,D-transpeptidase YcbB/YkuD
VLLGSLAAASVAGGSGALAQTAPAAPLPVQPVTTAVPTVSADVARIYTTYHLQPIWFKGGVVSPAASQLSAILRRATFDGFAEGPQLANDVDAVIAQARVNPAYVGNADQVLSSAWVRYVQALRRPTTGMIYAYAAMKPQGTRAEDILLTTSAAPVLSDYLTATSELNPVYGPLRNASWANAQATNNLTPDPRLLANLDRARSIPSRGRFALVDSGTQRLTLYDNGQPVDSMRVIVGTTELPTPLIASLIYYVTFNPYWHAPDHLVRRTIAPTVLRQGMKYLKTRGYHVMSQWGGLEYEVDPSTVDWKGAAAGTVHVLVQQDPGPLNSMGKLKFPFDNPEGIYLHDTPSKDLFGKNVRFLSNGCVRLEDARRFGQWLMGTEPIAPGTDPEMSVQLSKPVPIVLTYLTAEVVDGKLAYRDDVYGWDRNGPPQFASAN